MTVEGLNTWPSWRVTAKVRHSFSGRKQVLVSAKVVAPNGTDAIAAVMQDIHSRWATSHGDPETWDWNAKISGTQKVSVVHYV